jgi:hypothetical protein
MPAQRGMRIGINASLTAREVRPKAAEAGEQTGLVCMWEMTGR